MNYCSKHDRYQMFSEKHVDDVIPVSSLPGSIVVPHLRLGQQLSQVDAGDPLKLFKTHRSGRQPRPFQQSHEQVRLDVP
jgi:hypothetical protein